MSNMIRHIIFDRHGVLDYVTFADELLIMEEGTSLSSSDIIPIIQPYRYLYDIGEKTYEYVADAMRKHLHMSDGAIERVHNSILSIKVNYPLRALLSELKERYILSILSDCPLDKAEIIRSSTDLSCFRALHFSGEKGMTKNDDVFFIDILDALQIEQEAYHSVLFVDDSSEKIAKAADLGLQTCLFASTDDLISMI